ncbi:Proteophosphoglycan 5 [Rhodotorula toruloides]|nr:Proteophosphoglycan 5 [Rhodotorula toruloides]
MRLLPVMSHEGAAHLPADDLPLFARGSPAVALQTQLFLNSLEPFPSHEAVARQLQLLQRTAAARVVSQQLNARLKAFVARVQSGWAYWTPAFWAHYHDVMRKVSTSLMSGKADGSILPLLNDVPMRHPVNNDGLEATFNEAATKLSHRMNVDDEIRAHLLGRLSLLSRVAKEAFIQQVNYVDIWSPGRPLPSSDRILVNAELGGRYLQLLRHFHTAVMHSAPNEIERRRQEFQDSIPFSFFASLPLDLIDAIARETVRPRRTTELLHAESILRYAVLDVYSSKLGEIISLFTQDQEKRKDLKEWRDEYLEAFEKAMRTSWIGVGPPQEHRSRIWSAGAAQQYWLRYKGVVQTDWARLDAEWVRLVSLFCNSKRLPGIEAVHSDVHSLSRISLRAARRYGTTQRAWAAERESRTF